MAWWRRTMGAMGVAIVAGTLLVLAWPTDPGEPAEAPRLETASRSGAPTQAMASREERHALRDLRARRARDAQGRPIRIGELGAPPEEEDGLAASAVARVVERKSEPGSPEHSWDTMSREQRMAHARSEVEAALAGGRGGSPAYGERRAEAAALLGATRADFFASAEGEAEYLALEERVGE